METAFLGVPGVDALLFAELVLASFATTMFGVVAGTEDGLVLLAIMAFVFPPAVLLPVHTYLPLVAAMIATACLGSWVARSRWSACRSVSSAS